MKKALSALLGVLLAVGPAWAALPNQLKSARMTDSTLASTIDNEMGNLEVAITDILGIPVNTNVSAALFVVTASGLTNVVFQDLAGSPTAAGRLARNGINLEFHDGTAARVLVNTALAQTLALKTLTDPVINGTVTTTGLTMPAFAAGGTISGATGITSVGTIATGVWQGTAVGTQYGGTGQNFSATAQGNTVYFSAAGTLAALAPGTKGQLLITQGAAANPLWGGGQCKSLRKSADENITNNTLQNDDELLFAIGASESWIFKFVLFVTSASSTPEFQAAVTVPAAATVIWGVNGQSSGAAENSFQSRYITVSGTALGMELQAAEVKKIVIEGSVLNSTNAGNVTLRWSQETTNATATTVKAGSSLLACQIP